MTYKKVRMGKTERVTFSRINEVLEMPDLIEIQKNSYERFLKEGLYEALDDVSPITDFSENLVMEFVGYTLDEEHPKYSIEECKERDATYAAPMRLNVRLRRNDTGEIKEQDVFIGDFPLMTEQGTFIINGAERVIVSQLVRSPGVYYAKTNEPKTGRELFSAQIIPNRGAWLEYETDAHDILWVRVDRERKIPATVIVRAMGVGTDSQIISMFGEDDRLMATLERDKESNSVDEGIIEIYKRLRPGEPIALDSARSLFNSLFFDPKRYDLARVGRYKFSKKLALATRINGQVLAENIADPATGEIIATEGEKLTLEKARAIQNAGVNSVTITVEYERDREKTVKQLKVVGNNFVDASAFLPFPPKEAGLNEMVHYPTLMAIMAGCTSDDELREALRAHKSELIPKHIMRDDVLASFSYLLGLPYGIGTVDDIDHLGNRRLRSVGELLQNPIRVGLSRLERVVKERMAVQDPETVTPQALINTRPVSAAIKEFFGSSQLSQFMDQPNPLAELTHKRRLSALGPGGLNRERASFEVRDVHYTHYGRMCPIETPEGQNIGLINSLSTYAKVNEYGFIEAPYRRVDKEKGVVTDIVDYLTADEEDFFIVAQANEPLDEEGHFMRERVAVRIRDQITESPASSVDYMDVSPKQLVSVATAMIPFLENDDSTRALMGSNMQRQAVPLIKPEAPIIGTGMEYKAAMDSGVLIRAYKAGTVERVTGDEIVIQNDDATKHTYRLKKFLRSNQGTCINQHPVVKPGEHVDKGQCIADGPSTDNGEIALGRNVLIGFMTWEGYNYEDAILISEKLVKEDVYTSIHIEEYESEARDTKLGAEEITRDIPNVGNDALADLDERGIVRIGAEVRSGDILVGKVTPKGETELTSEERLLRAIFGEKAREVRDTSLRVPHGEGGIIVDVKVFTRENSDELSPGVNELVRVFIAQRRKISVGDKMAGRHGNKGVISRILPEEDMPFLPDGTPLEIVLNPLGVPSRMNLGQILEVHLGLAAKRHGFKVATNVFDGATEEQIADLLEECGMRRDGKSILYDGRTGEPFDNPVTVGYMYMMKLIHLVDDKIHARSTGPYSLVTQQPLGGKAQFGGQRFGEMEVWALEAYGAANTLQEILTVKSDDIVGRVKTYEAIVKGENIPPPGIPESLKVLIKELRSLCLDVKVLTQGNVEVDLSEMTDDTDMFKPTMPMIDEAPESTSSDNSMDYDFDMSSLGMNIDDDFASFPSDLYTDQLDLDDDDKDEDSNDDGDDIDVLDDKDDDLLNIPDLDADDENDPLIDDMFSDDDPLSGSDE